ncbi:hypothetical protein N9N39_01495 [Candidatus Pelagibacter bacterium]|nr:hypothetical protein [Candidatus Pelagibacter bacterium]MDA8825395.1 hypothetical protein [Candidatus Pelagibacter bacterium]
MSSKKFILASSAKWSEMLIIIGVNILSVPIILSKWSMETFAAWILLQSVTAYINMPNLAYQEFVHNINLKLGHNKKKDISINIASGVPFTICVSLLVVLLLVIELNFQFVTNNLNITDDVKYEWTMALLLYGVYSLLTYSVSPFLSYTTHIFGYLPLLTWISTIRFFLSQLAILIAINFYNASLVSAFTTSLIVQMIIHIIEYIIIFLIFKKENIKYISINLKKGFNNYGKSLWLTLTFVLDNVATNGLRILIITLLNPLNLVIFSTIRTITNTLTQGLESIKQPFLTELMKNFSNKNKNKVQINIEIYYLFISIVVFPTIIILQFFIQDVYKIWTLGNIEFNLEIYTILIISVLVASVSLPFRIIIGGHNLVKKRFKISLIKSIFLLLFILTFYKSLKILSFAFGLLLSELLELILNYNIVLNFFKKTSFNYKKRIFIIVLINLLACSFLLVLFSSPTIKFENQFIVILGILSYFSSMISLIKSSNISLIKIVKEMFIK